MAELLRHADAVARGLTTMAVTMLLEDLPETLARVVGERQAAVLLERLAAPAAERGFREFLEAAGAEPPEPLEALTVFLAPRGGGGRLHPFQVAEAIETGDGRASLRLAGRGWGLAKASLVAGVVAGVLRALGLEARPLTGPEALAQLCRGEPPAAAVYPEQRAGAWRVTVDFHPCRGPS